ncbi:MAG: hypothetical protein KA885_12215, partial [Spirochaetes bacterium]|nr:hypothetical protein [Spirochaetota bacterium]
NHLIQLKSILASFLVILKKLTLLSVRKQEAILKQNWNDVFIIANEMEEIADFVNKKDGELVNIIKITDIFSNSDIQAVKKEIKELIIGYKEVENTNARLLNDNLFVVKQKFEKLYNKKGRKDTYEKDLNKKNMIFDNRSIVLNRLA